MAIPPARRAESGPAPLTACLEKGRTRIEMSHDTTLEEIDAAHSADGSADGEPSDGEQAGTAGGEHGSGPAPEHEPSEDGEAWTWATEHSAPERATTEQLVRWLAQGNCRRTRWYG